MKRQRNQVGERERQSQRAPLLALARELTTLGEEKHKKQSDKHNAVTPKVLLELKPPGASDDAVLLGLSAASAKR